MESARQHSVMERICGDYFFSFKETVNTTSPDVSQCFQHTILVWLPCLFFWLFCPFLLYDLHKSNNLPLRWGAFIIIKISSSVILALDALFLLLWTVYEWKIIGKDTAPVWFIYPIILSLTMAATVVLLVACKNRGVITSGVLFLFWMLLAICGLPEFRWWIRSAVENDGKPEDFVRFVLYMVWYPLVVVQFLASCFADRAQPYTDINKEVSAFDLEHRNPCPELHTSFLNQITFQWFTGMAILGNKRPLETADLWSLNDQDASQNVVPDFEKRWLPALRRYTVAKQQYEAKQQSAVEFNHEEVQIIDGNRRSSKSATSAAKPPQPPSVLWPLFKTYKGPFLAGLLLKLTFDLMQFISPQLLSLLIGFIDHKERPLWQGVAIASLMFIVALIQSMILHQYFHKMFRLGMNIRSVLTAAVFTKSLRLSNAERKNRTVGEIVNLMSVDIQRFQDMTTFVMLFWSAPLQVTLSIVFLWQILGPAVLAGLAVLIAMVPLNSFLSIKMRKYQVEQMKHKDDRLKMMSEILNGMKVLKLYAWEPSMEKMVLDIRKKEITVLKKLAFLNAATTLSWACAPFMVAVLTFGVYVTVDPENNILTPQITFVSLALFNILRFPLAIFAMIISQAVQCVVSNKRLKSFLSADEMDPSLVDRTSATSRDAIVIENGLFTWDRSAEFQLKDINVALPRDKLIAVVGKVGSGKSSLLAAMLGEMDKLRGYVSAGGTVAYAPQQAWIQNLSLKDNITFGQRFDPVWYNTVVDACALRADFDTLPAGDNTEIGEKGINLSGGQKQRVSLARAVYQRRDIILLDDPLSAVDSHVGKHIFDHVIGPSGLLAGKTRVLVTHGLHYLKHCDQIIVLREGTVSETGTYKELIANAGAFAEFLEEYLIKEAKERTTSVSAEDDIGEEMQEVLTELAKYDPNCRHRIQTQISQISQLSRDADSSSTAGSPPPIDGSLDRSRSPTIEGSARQRRVQSLSAQGEDDPAKQPLKPIGTPSKDAQPAAAVVTEKSKLIEKEATETGKVQSDTIKIYPVKWEVYMTYIKAIGYVIALVFVTIYILSSVLGVLSNLWLADWSDDAKKHEHNKTVTSISVRLAVYTALGLGQAVFVCLASILMALGMVHASRILHEGILRNILRSAMSFFDVTPLGRILNRVGKDVEVIDGSLPQNIRAFLMTVTSVFMTIIVIIVATPIFSAVIVPLSCVYFLVLDVDVLDFRLPDAIRMFITTAISTVMTFLIVVYVTPLTTIAIVPASVLYVYALDVDVMDAVLPRSVIQFIQCAVMSLEIMLVVISVTPPFIVVLLPLFIVYYLAMRFYVSTSRQLKRLESVTRSPIYSHFQETVQGAPSIRAYNAVDRFVVESERRVDANLVTYYPSLGANRWLAVRLELVGNLIVLFAALFAVLFRESDSVTPGLVGLSVSYALNITQTLNWAVRMTSELETNIVAVERIKEYSDTPTEAALEADGDNKPPAEWPERGAVDFDDYQVRYRPGLDLVLKGITAHIEPQEKIGIVGRTGAGKSSLTLALFRIIEADKGRILIDGRDISKMGLHDLRSKLTIVPQDPVLFSGTLRINLDPFLRHTDDQIWLALENAHLKPFVVALADKLDHRVSEGGENLSVGQRQLVCLARALLRKTKLLILDEAAAAVDMETDALIQKTIRKEFADCTVLTIAHRLNTVLDSDRMLVLDNGRIVEFDSPTKLLADNKTVFYSMAKDAGIVS